MITTNLRINQLPSGAYEWYLRYLGALDRLDIEAYCEFLDPACTVQSNNSDPIVGLEAIREQLGAYWMAFASLEHDLKNIYGDARNFVLEADNIYKRHDGRTVVVRAVAFTDVNESGKVSAVRFYTDMSPVFSD